MKPSRIALAILIAMYLFGFSSEVVNAETWRITSLSWPPYSGPDVPNQGTSIDKLRKLLEKAGIELTVEFYPWVRAQNQASKKEYVGYFPSWIDEVKEGFISSPAIDFSSIGVLAYSGSKTKWRTIDALFQENQVGLVKGYVYPDEIEEAAKKYPEHVDYAPNEVLLARKLSKNRDDAALTDPKVMMYIAKKESLKNIVVVKKVVMQKALVMAFRNDEKNRKRIELLKDLLKKTPPPLAEAVHITAP